MKRRHSTGLGTVTPRPCSGLKLWLSTEQITDASDDGDSLLPAAVQERSASSLFVASSSARAPGFLLWSGMACACADSLCLCPRIAQTNAENKA